MRAILAAFAFMAAVVPARAATFTLTNGFDGRPAVRISGDLLPGDLKAFGAFGTSHPRVYSIIVSGQGGALMPAIEIGKFAHDMQMQTVVPPGQECSSACALLWAGGIQRKVGTGAQIGFHSVFTMADGTPRASGPGDALAGAYLARLGFTDAAIVYMTQQPPTSMAWLTRSDAQTFGIMFEMTSNERGAVAPKP